MVKCNYLVIFDRKVSWNENVKIMNWVALESGNIALQSYVRMQCIKGSSTVRVSRKGSKPIPRIVFRYGSQNSMIKKFLETRSLILGFLKKNKEAVVYGEAEVNKEA